MLEDRGDILSIQSPFPLLKSLLHDIAQGKALYLRLLSSMHCLISLLLLLASFRGKNNRSFLNDKYRRNPQ